MPGPVPSPTVFALLDTEWAATLAPTPLPARWHRQPALAPHHALNDLLHATEQRGDPAHSDQILAALARLATDPETPDELAARALLQMLLPGAKALARRLAWLGDPAERAAAVTACLYEQIRTYPIQRRPARIAANLLADTHQRLLRANPGAREAHCQPQEVSLDALAALGEPAVPPVPPGPADPSPAEALLGLLAWAVSDGHLTVAQANLIGQSRIADVPCQQLGAGAGLGAHSLRRRRQRAEQALARATSGRLAEEDLPDLARQCRNPDRASRRPCLIYRDALV
jgi:hypothetical protein